MSPAVELPNGRVWVAWNSPPTPDRPPLLLIHGAGGNRLSWPPELRRLAGHSVLVLDLPGHGRSAGPAGESIAAHAATAAGLLEALGVSRAVVGGHSMGGAIAQMMALDDPERVAGLVLMGTGARLRVSSALLDGLLEDYPRTIELIGGFSFGPAAPLELRRRALEVMRETGQVTLRADFLACDRFDVSGRLAEIQAPTLVLAGTADRMTPLKLARQLAREIPDASLETVEGGGHMFVLEQPGVVAAAVARFMGRLS